MKYVETRIDYNVYTKRPYEMHMYMACICMQLDVRDKKAFRCIFKHGGIFSRASVFFFFHTGPRVADPREYSLME